MLGLQVRVQTSQVKMLPTNVRFLSWDTFNEDISSANDDSTITVFGLLDQLNLTRDASDYLWYTTRWNWIFLIFLFHLNNVDIFMWWIFYQHIMYVSRVDISPSESFLHQGQHPTITVQSAGHAMHLFINGRHSGESLNLLFSERLYNWTGPCYSMD